MATKREALEFAIDWLESFDAGNEDADTEAPYDTESDERRNIAVAFLRKELAKMDREDLIRKAAKEHGLNPKAVRKYLKNRS